MTVRYDPRDLAEIRVYHHDEFLCRAGSAEIATVGVSMQDLQVARNQRRRNCGRSAPPAAALVELLTQPAKPTAGVTDNAGGASAAARPSRPGTRLKLYRRTDSTTHGEEHQVAEHFTQATRMMPPRMLVGFEITKQHRRFVEFADAVRRHRYIGV